MWAQYLLLLLYSLTCGSHLMFVFILMPRSVTWMPHKMKTMSTRHVSASYDETSIYTTEKLYLHRFFNLEEMLYPVLGLRDAIQPRSKEIRDGK